MKSYSMDLRKRVARAHAESGSSADVAEQFGCSESWVRRLVQRERETGSLEPLPARRPDGRKLNGSDRDRLRQMIGDAPDMTLGELATALDNKVSVPTVWRETRRLGLVLKKSPSTPPSRTGPTSRRGATAGSIGSRTRS